MATAEIALTLEIVEKNIETPDWSNDLITVMEFLLSKLFEKSALFQSTSLMRLR